MNFGGNDLVPVRNGFALQFFQSVQQTLPVLQILLKIALIEQQNRQLGPLRFLQGKVTRLPPY